MPIVKFLPADISVEVPAGTCIHEAAIKAGVENLHLPCGGKGTCGKCLVEVVSGDVQAGGHTALSDALRQEHLVMACQTKVSGDLVIRIRPVHESTMRALGDSHLLVSEELLPDKDAPMTPLFGVLHLTVPQASIDEHYSDWQRLVRTMSPVIDDLPVTTDVGVLRSLAEVLRLQDGRVTVSLQETDCGLRVLEVRPGHEDVRGCGLAIDIGTTTVAVQMVDLHNGEVLDSRTAYNGQLCRGADVISRIDYARRPERLQELRSLVLDTVNGLSREILDNLHLEAETIQAAFIAGNTTMIHLLLGLPPQHIRETPYVPTVNTLPTFNGAEAGLLMNRGGVVAFSPGVGSYVGGDITSGLLCTELPTNSEGVFLFLDIGTNGEIVLGNADWMVTCACSAGPAFEGSGIKCGMRAVEGAIEYLEISADAAEVRYDVIADGKPAGICGSGLICLLGELLLSGIVDQSGRFNEDLQTDRLIKVDNVTGFVLEWGANTRDGADLVITEADIENLMRTKAAIYAACSLILSNVGLDWSMISRVFIGGGFGRYIKVEDAVIIGLLPDLPPELFAYVGNSSLTGAYCSLLSRKHRQALSRIAAGMTYIDLSSDTRYMDSYLSALFLPHTDMGQFPTVAKGLSAFAGLGVRSQEPGV
ncbi:MAG: ASKHA domain-containing protein [bacterium]|nr:ASKHA domain-containing protein [bacterium]